MQICNQCGMLLVNGRCPHCGIGAKAVSHITISECRDQLRAYVDKQDWRQAEICALQGQQQWTNEKEFLMGELLALSEGLKKAPSSQQTSARVQELLRTLGKTGTFHCKTYNLDAYRARLRSNELASEPVGLRDMFIGLLVLLVLLGLIVFLFTHPAILAKIVLVVIIGCLVISFLAS